jgi:hypothetical protein
LCIGKRVSGQTDHIFWDKRSNDYVFFNLNE